MTKKLTISALLVALAMILSYVEVLIPFNFGIPGHQARTGQSGGRCGPVSAECQTGTDDFRCTYSACTFTFGNMAALLYSITGGLLSFAVMVLCRRIKGLSTMSVSVAAASATTLARFW